MAQEFGESKQIHFLKATIRKASQDVVNSLSDEIGVSLLAEVHHYKKDKKVKLINMLRDKILSDVEAYLNEIIESENLDEILRNRETIIQKQKHWEGSIAWRPSGSVTEDIRSRDMEILRKKTEQMGERCRREEVELDALCCKVNELRSQNLNFQKCIDDAKKLFDEVNSLTEGEEAANIRMIKSLYNDQEF